jgi:dTDP-glucose pyrophosphorylase
MNNWQSVVIEHGALLKEALSKINASSLQVALVLSPDKTLAGILTDGDIRRALLAGKNLQTSVLEVMNSRPIVASASMARSKMLSLMRRHVLHQLPLIGENNQVVGLVTLDDLIGALNRPNWVVLMAGGLGTRLHPLTQDCPKPLLTVGGKPILEIIIESFIEQGFNQIFLSVNYKAEMIEDYFKDGAQWGANLTYLYEKERLGTAGALSLLPEMPSHAILVMNSDILTRVRFDNLLQFHESEGAVATMVVRQYDYQVPYGVVHVDGSKIQAIEEKPVQNFFVNAGIYALSPPALEYLPGNTFFDMPTLFERLIAANQVTAAYPLREYWIDIGRMSDLEKANQQIGELVE